MQLDPVLHGVRASLEGQAALAGNDPSVAEAVSTLVDAIGPIHHAVDLVVEVGPLLGKPFEYRGDALAIDEVVIDGGQL